MEPKTIWVIAVDYGYEGLADPFISFLQEEDAKRSYKLMNEGGNQCYKLIEVPLWPNVGEG